MRFLKNKIAKANAAYLRNLQRLGSPQGSPLPNEKGSPEKKPVVSKVSLKRKRNRIPGTLYTPLSSLATKNIVKNYGRAICNFAASPLAVPYLLDLTAKENVRLEDFVKYVLSVKSSINGLSHFRSSLLDKKSDTREVTLYKKIFRGISEIFVKYFSVNWIFHSKVLHKMAHIKFRFKMLRRIQHPELFTYLNYTTKIGERKINKNKSP